MSERFDEAKVYMNELKSIKDEYIKSKVQAFEVHKSKLSLEFLHERFHSLVEKYNFSLF